jgi:hypothetical protein
MRHRGSARNASMLNYSVLALARAVRVRAKPLARFGLSEFHFVKLQELRPPCRQAVSKKASVTFLGLAGAAVKTDAKKVTPPALDCGFPPVWVESGYAE